MAKRGDFVWYELMTTDPAGAQDFYKDVVGWGTAPFENASGMDYTMWTKGESMVGGVMELPEEARKGGAPPPTRTSPPSAKRTPDDAPVRSAMRASAVSMSDFTAPDCSVR